MIWKKSVREQLCRERSCAWNRLGLEEQRSRGWVRSAPLPRAWRRLGEGLEGTTASEQDLPRMEGG